MTLPGVAAILFDRDGTLVRDVAYNNDPDLVEPMPTAAAAVELARRSGAKLAVVSNQSGIGRGILSPAEVNAVNARIDRMLGPFDTWCMCPHTPEDLCGCRKPQPGLVTEAAARLGVRPDRTVLVGDIGADMAAAHAAGARAILVPTPVTLEHEIDEAPALAATLLEAVRFALDLEPVLTAESRR